MTMCNTVTLMVLSMLGALVLLLGAEGTSANEVRKIPRRSRRLSRSREVKTDNFVDLILDPNAMASSTPLLQIGSNSLSPWTVSYTHEEDRFPQKIAKVTCLLKGCLNAGGQEVMDFESKPIIHQILVLRRVEVDPRHYAYKLETEAVPVGCTCVRPNVLQQE